MFAAIITFLLIGWFYYTIVKDFFDEEVPEYLQYTADVFAIKLQYNNLMRIVQYAYDFIE